MSKPTLYMYVGLPGSGKSTYAGFLAEEIKAKVVSSDALRAEWYGSEEIQGNPAKIFAEIERRCFTELSESRSVIMDATNMNAGKRTKFLQKMPKDINSVCCVMAVPFADCVANDKKRSRSVGEEVIAKMRRNFQMPNYNEGWTEIWIHYPFNAKYTDDEERYHEEMAFDQKNHHHTLTLGKHEDKAFGIAVQEGYHDWVWIATQYHDCGKLFCQTFNDKGPDAHYYGHECISAYEFLTMVRTKADWDLGERERVIHTASLITWHMIPYQFHGFSSVKEQEDKVVEWCLDHGFSSTFAECLWQLHMCDLLAH